MTEVTISKEALKENIISALKEIYDPEIPVNIYDLGLIYDIEIDDEYHVLVNMTLTSPACPVAQTLPLNVKDKVMEVEGVVTAKIELVWDPPWSMENLSEAAKLALGVF